MTKLGFTGTRRSLTVAQHKALSDRVRRNTDRVAEAHHGCCVGADSEFAEILGSLAPEIFLVTHPPINRQFVDRLAEIFADERRRPRPYLQRNHDIVNETDEMWACPAGPEELRSGTWSTVRFARKLGRPIAIFWPDGTVTTEGGAG